MLFLGPDSAWVNTPTNDTVGEDRLVLSEPIKVSYSEFISSS